MATPAQPAKKPSKLKKGCGGCAIAFAAFTVIGIIGQLAGAGSKGHNQAAASPSPSSKPSATQSKPPSPTKPPSAKATAAPAAAPAQAPSLAPGDARTKAADILKANDAYYRDEFNNGVTVILARGSANSYPPFHAWYEKAATDVQPGMDAFKQADAYFNADNEPGAISDWQGDNGNLSADVAQLASDGLGVGGPDDATYRQKVQDDIGKMDTDYKAAEADADKVAAGK